MKATFTIDNDTPVVEAKATRSEFSANTMLDTVREEDHRQQAVVDSMIGSLENAAII